MLRITKAFENDATTIYKIEGKITDESLEVWAEELANLKETADRQTILDLSRVWSLSRKALEVLVESVAGNLYVLNCPMEIRNALHAAGLSARMLE